MNDAEKLDQFSNEENSVVTRPEILASLASVALPGRTFTAYREIIDATSETILTVEVTESTGEKFFMRLPKREEAATDFEAEITITNLLNSKGDLKFRIPQLISTAQVKQKFVGIASKFAVFEPFWGQSVQPSQMTEAQVKETANMFASIHTLQYSIVENAGLPSRTAKQVREKNKNTLDKVALTGRVPGTLLTRWEEFLSNDENWTFDSTVIHGNIFPKYILFDGDEISYVFEWRELQLGDPAHDLAGITPTLSLDNNQQFYLEYRRQMSKKNRNLSVDAAIEERAEFYAGFELAEKLLKAHENHNFELEDILSTELHLLDEKLRLGSELSTAIEDAQKEEEIRLEHANLRAEQDAVETTRLPREQLNISSASPSSSSLAELASQKPATGETAETQILEKQEQTDGFEEKGLQNGVQNSATQNKVEQTAQPAPQETAETEKLSFAQTATISDATSENLDDNSKELPLDNTPIDDEPNFGQSISMPNKLPESATENVIEKSANNQPNSENKPVSALASIAHQAETQAEKEPQTQSQTENANSDKRSALAKLFHRK